jgi:hypothetical protein
MSSRSLIGLALITGALGACRSDRPTPDAATAAPKPSPSIANYTFTASDYTFAGPAQIPAGTAAIRLVNQGKEPHHLVLLRLDPGKTFEDVQAALRQPGPPPTWVHPVGGPNGVDPGLTSNATLALTPGLYVALCFIPSPDGAPHMSKGMASKLEVTPATEAAAPEPTADVVIKLTDYAFDVSAPLKAGPQTIRVENAGPQLHEVELAHLAPGKKLEDLMAWAAGGEKGPPPASFIGGAAPMQPGEHNTFSANLEAGDYVLICFVPDDKDGKEHLRHGMTKQMTVS